MQIDGAYAEMHWPSNAPRNNTHALPKSIPSVRLTNQMTLLSVATGRFLFRYMIGIRSYSMLVWDIEAVRGSSSYSLRCGKRNGGCDQMILFVGLGVWRAKARPVRNFDLGQQTTVAQCELR